MHSSHGVDTSVQLASYRVSFEFCFVVKDLSRFFMRPSVHLSAILLLHW